ncbi:MAG: hypothetical protein WBG90_09775 [Saonia sp.]
MKKFQPLSIKDMARYEHFCALLKESQRFKLISGQGFAIYNINKKELKTVTHIFQKEDIPEDAQDVLLFPLLRDATKKLEIGIYNKMESDRLKEEAMKVWDKFKKTLNIQ